MTSQQHQEDLPAVCLLTDRELSTAILQAERLSYLPAGMCPAGAATALLMVTIAPQNTFPVSACQGDDCYNNAAAWCIFSAMEPTYLHRLEGGGRVLLANVIGQVGMLVIAQLVNNLDPCEGYPQRWL